MKKLYILLLSLSVLALWACSMNDLQNLSSNNKTQEKVQKTNNQDNTNKSTTKQGNNNQTTNKEWISNGNKFIGFVATWCPHCQEAVPTLEKFATQTNGKIEINVVNKNPFPWVKNLKQEYNNPKSYKDYTNEECGYIPSYVIVDANGKVIEKKCGGSLDYEQLKAKLLKSWNKQEASNQETNLKNNNKQMTENVVKKWDTIAVDYVGKFEDGKLFDTSIEEEAKKAGLYNSARTYKPLEFKVGEWQMIPCFDKWVENMKVWETKEITCEPKDAYGECLDSKIIKVEKTKLADFEKNGYKLEKW